MGKQKIVSQMWLELGGMLQTGSGKASYKGWLFISDQF
jgi:hypothetical protein